MPVLFIKSVVCELGFRLAKASSHLSARHNKSLLNSYIIAVRQAIFVVYDWAKDPKKTQKLNAIIVQEVVHPFGGQRFLSIKYI